ncbi:MAG: HAMP domain-containing histidine kinase [Lachnospiraceae bacterium]|nr:HAMP domain-containing histidine kinase [Lachnospiraceae bacterium]
MKQFRRLVIFTIIYFAICLVLIRLAGHALSGKETNNRTAFMNRMTAQIRETRSTDITEVSKDFKKNDVTDDIEVFYTEEGGLPASLGGGNNSYLWPLADGDGNTEGYVLFSYDSKANYRLILLAYLAACACILPFVGVLIYFYHNILKPFREFSEYPEKLSKGLTTDNLPETKNRFFGKYVWGMNMLNDKLEADRKQIDRLLYDRKQFISTLAHGIKTPVANIKLYSEAIETGLYRGGKADEKDAEIACKISKNADDIATLVGGILNDPGSLRTSFTPSFGNFYLEDVKTRLCEDFENRLKVKDIPFEVSIFGNPVVVSDFEAIMRCLTQLMENAIKYGDGTGIFVRLYRQDDFTFFSVCNNGVSLTESEIPLVFNCYFRGSNAEGKEGSGIGLYEAKSVAKALGGDMMMKAKESQTEVILYIPDK